MNFFKTKNHKMTDCENPRTKIVKWIPCEKEIHPDVLDKIFCKTTNSDLTYPCACHECLKNCWSLILDTIKEELKDLKRERQSRGGKDSDAANEKSGYATASLRTVFATANTIYRKKFERKYWSDFDVDCIPNIINDANFHTLNTLNKVIHYLDKLRSYCEKTLLEGTDFETGEFDAGKLFNFLFGIYVRGHVLFHIYTDE